MERLMRRTILITGAGSGLGRDLAGCFAAGPFRVLVTDRDADAAQETCEQLGVDNAVASSLDVTSREEVDAWIDRWGEEPIDVLINNAGLQHVAPIEEFDPATWDRLLDVMLHGAARMTRAVLPGMRSRGFGRIVNIGSIHSLVASPFKSAYVAAKHGLLGLAKTVALETADTDITINTICPSYIRTPLVDRQIAQQAEVHGLSEEDVIDQIMLQPMPKKAFITAEEVYVDGKAPDSPIAVKCHPVAGIDKADPTVSSAFTEDEGKFSISTYEKGDGIPPGEYILTFYWGKRNVISMNYGGPDKLKGRYKDVKKSKIKAPAAEKAASAEIPRALFKYVAKPSPEFAWKQREQTTSKAGKIYHLDLTSQKWHGIVWTHALTVFEPKKIRHPDHVLLFVSGGKVGRRPGKRDLEMGMQLAHLCAARVALLNQVPNQPLLGNRVEDDLITETWLKYLESGDETWPLLFPMVKSAVKAMDAVEQLAAKEWKRPVKGFVVTGASKRGWTSWLTAVADKRIVATAPIVINVLNFRAQMKHQLEVWGKYSEQIVDYTSKGLIKGVDEKESPREIQLRTMMDPWTYRSRLMLPKLLIHGTNDRYWVVDAMNLYWKDLSGPKFVRQVPNAGHSLKGGREGALTTLGAFFQQVVSKSPLPKVTWNYKAEDKQLRLTMQARSEPKTGRIWIAHSETKDFRNAKWEPKDVPLKNGRFSATVPRPKSGYVAVFGELIFQFNGLNYALSSQIYRNGGKDSALALHALRGDDRYDVVALLTTLTREYDRIAMHGVRRDLLHAQAESIGLPLTEVWIQTGAGNDEYEADMSEALTLFCDAGTTTAAFGDLFLEDIRAYRERLVDRLGVTPLFPLWGLDTRELAAEFVAAGFRATTCCVDTNALPAAFCGRELNEAFFHDLPVGVDPCGENGEFHTFVSDGPIFKHPIDITTGEERCDGRFVFRDIVPL
eukprot:g33077.t1